MGYWISANYSLSEKGMEVVDRAEEIDTIPPRAVYMREVALAFATLELEGRDRAALSDVNYESAVEETPVHYGDDKDNLAPFAAASLLSEDTPSVRRLNCTILPISGACSIIGEKICLLMIAQRGHKPFLIRAC
ncbi:MAG: hypothetical protein WDM81_20915 [Rhizomicrobium sp.]